MVDSLTDKSFWIKYWQNKENVISIISKKYVFADQFKEIVENNNVNNSIELGGFPGYFSVYLRKYLQLEVTLMDRFISPKIIKELSTLNGVAYQDINIIEADLFNDSSEVEYDLVFSCGLIEHFRDVKLVIDRHLSFAKQDGVIFIAIPNFRGLNGLFQKIFDKDNYDKHNIDIMDPEVLADICSQSGAQVIYSKYSGRFGVWLEDEKNRSSLVRILRKSISLIGRVIAKILKFESRFFSPFIILKAIKH